jgi:hypothetical protein
MVLEKADFGIMQTIAYFQNHNSIDKIINDFEDNKIFNEEPKIQKKQRK